GSGASDHPGMTSAFKIACSRPASAAGALPPVWAYTRINPSRKSEEHAMNPPVAARTQSSTPSLHDRLKDPSLLRDRCYIDGAWVGTPSRPVTNPVNGVELAKVPAMSTAEATQAVEAAERAFPAWAKLTAKQRSNILRKWFDLIIA